MRIPLSLLFLTLVFAEIAAFVMVGEAIGVLATLGLVLLGMIGGVALLRRQGMATLSRVRGDMAAGRTPARPLAEGAVQVLAALLIVVPGFVTDVIGLLLLVPAVRAALWRRFGRAVQARASGGARAVRPVLDLERGEYDSHSTPRAGVGRPAGESPWRRGPGRDGPAG